jgi:hypothetical protein
MVLSLYLFRVGEEIHENSHIVRLVDASVEFQTKHLLNTFVKLNAVWIEYLSVLFFSLCFFNSNSAVN